MPEMLPPQPLRRQWRRRPCAYRSLSTPRPPRGPHEGRRATSTFHGTFDLGFISIIYPVVQASNCPALTTYHALWCACSSHANWYFFLKTMLFLIYALRHGRCYRTGDFFKRPALPYSVPPSAPPSACTSTAVDSPDGPVGPGRAGASGGLLAIAPVPMVYRGRRDHQV